jgi:hypothetical protein
MREACSPVPGEVHAYENDESVSFTILGTGKFIVRLATFVPSMYLPTEVLP